jgi:uncharacterized protein
MALPAAGRSVLAFPPRLRLVLDTNIWLDWLVFDDFSVAPLKQALHAGRVRIAINAACIDELRRVLAYPQFGLDAARQDALLTEVRCATMTIASTQVTPLPLCSDADDQKFLELARDAGADWLISKDKALLRLGGTRLLAAGFRVGTPQQWVVAMGRGRGPR